MGMTAIDSLQLTILALHTGRHALRNDAAIVAKTPHVVGHAHDSAIVTARILTSSRRGTGSLRRAIGWSACNNGRDLSGE